ncbi:MAG: hypothetical protein BWX80_03517 [Candidatus Hydrogenedentes bacterium ADurb.Bin101]|nr:MAG: hypothetical protein BWX80_03517 [Candidatus Hydrogenedentes bacterium ADurb.Bin101]
MIEHYLLKAPGEYYTHRKVGHNELELFFLLAYPVLGAASLCYIHARDNAVIDLSL